MPGSRLPRTGWPQESPGCSLGVNENAVPHFRAEAFGSPWLAVSRSTNWRPQFGQFRFSSGTCGFFMIACAASIIGAGGNTRQPSA